MDVVQGRYEIRKVLGSGHGYRTCLAQDLQTQTLVVIKQRLFRGQLKWEALGGFEREAHALTLLNHPAIPRYLDYFDVETETGHGFALVQRFVAADSLRQKMNSDRGFNEAELQAIARKVLGVLAYLHRHRPPMIHRNINPSNILLSTEPEDAATRSAYLADQIFLVGFETVHMQNEDSICTDADNDGYMPPEQLSGHAVPASDLYGLGATLIYLASGQHPVNLPKKNLHLLFASQVRLSCPFIEWLSTLTALAASQRFSSAQQALQALNDTCSPPTTPSYYRVSPKVFSKGVRSGKSRPVGSKVSFVTDSSQLEVVIPPTGFTPILVVEIIFALIWNSFVVLWCWGAFSAGSAGLFATMIALPHICVGFLLLFHALYTFSGSATLTINGHTVSLGQKIFGFSYQPSESATRDRPIQIETSVSSGRVDSHAKGAYLNIWVGEKKFALGHGHSLSTAEAKWLAGELSDWLNLSA